ncbi:MAG: hypothetical protein HDS04_06665 [Bacteroides sp.]|nr:hypothetical protein [Bacteroides sp.]
MQAKIINVQIPGIPHYRGEIRVGQLFEVLTDKGTYNLSRPELLSLLENVGKPNVKRITEACVRCLVGTFINISKIADK